MKLAQDATTALLVCARALYLNLVRYLHTRCAFTDPGTYSEEEGAILESECVICQAGTYSYEAATECTDWSVDRIVTQSLQWLICFDLLPTVPLEDTTTTRRPMQRTMTP